MSTEPKSFEQQVRELDTEFLRSFTSRAPNASAEKRLWEIIYAIDAMKRNVAAADDALRLAERRWRDIADEQPEVGQLIEVGYVFDGAWCSWTGESYQTTLDGKWWARSDRFNSAIIMWRPATGENKP